MLCPTVRLSGCLSIHQKPVFCQNDLTSAWKQHLTVALGVLIDMTYKRGHIVSSLLHAVVDFSASLSFVQCWPRVGPGPPLYIHFLTFPPYALSFSIFSLFPFLLASSIFLLFRPSNSTRIVPLRFQSGCRRRRLNLTLFFVDFVLYVFL